MQSVGPRALNTFGWDKKNMPHEWKSYKRNKLHATVRQSGGMKGFVFMC